MTHIRVNRPHPILTFDSLREVKAYYFASAAHGAIDQRRKYTNEPYIEHPLQVWKLVRSLDGTEYQCAAALLHDVVEDTRIELSTIEKLFGQKTAKMVEELTKVSKPEDGNRLLRHSMDLAKLSSISPEAQTVKLADIFCNSATIRNADHEFARIYLNEKLDEVSVLTCGLPELREEALKMIKLGLAIIDDVTAVPKGISTADEFFAWLHKAEPK
jgi:(p)ppGpp synthase/HD superfamily hydrolase